MRRDLVSSAIAVVVLTLVLGVGYPLLTTAVSQVVFPNRADGSRVTNAGRTVGSRLIGQDFRRPVRGPDGRPVKDAGGAPVLEADPHWFQSRPSATDYDAAGTFFNNRGPNDRDLSDFFATQVRAYLALERPYDPGLRRADVPVDAVTTSGSGVDPHISVANARIQAHRVAAVRRIPLRRVLRLVDANTDGRGLGFAGEPGVDVLELNLAIAREARR